MKNIHWPAIGAAAVVGAGIVAQAITHSVSKDTPAAPAA